jgi:hypothetical protein
VIDGLSSLQANIQVAASMLKRSLMYESVVIFAPPLRHQSFEAFSATELADISFGVGEVSAVFPNSDDG